MAEEKRHPATERHLEKAREEGRVPESQDLLHACSNLAVMLVLDSLVRRYYGFALDYLQEFVQQLGRIRQDEVIRYDNIVGWFAAALSLSLFVGVVAGATGLLVSWGLSGGPVIKKTPIAFKLDALSPQHYFGKVFSTKTVVSLASHLVKAAALALVFTRAIRHAIAQLPQVIPEGIAAVTRALASDLADGVRAALIVLLAIGIADYLIQRRLHLRDLRMSREEIKEEMKESEGDPHFKQHRRGLARELVEEDPKQVRDPLAGANALVVNPTHIAVGLRYFAAERRLPRIRIRAEEEAAQALIDHAAARGVPVIRHIWLARTLYYLPPRAPLPRETYRALALVFRIVEALEREDGSEASPEMPVA